MRHNRVFYFSSKAACIIGKFNGPGKFIYIQRTRNSLPTLILFIFYLLPFIRTLKNVIYFTITLFRINTTIFLAAKLNYWCRVRFTFFAHCLVDSLE